MDFLDHYQRVKRFYFRFKQRHEGNVLWPKEFDLNYIYNERELILDEAYTFFIFAHHIKDWFINDKSVSIEREKDKKRFIDNFINENDDLCICADICNGAKHLDIIYRSVKRPKISSCTITALLENGQVKHKSKIIISTIVGNYDAFDIATKCLSKWEELMNSVLIEDEHGIFRRIKE
jgi:hypothetical protein